MSEFSNDASRQGSDFTEREFPIAPEAIHRAHHHFENHLHITNSEILDTYHQMSLANTYLHDFEKQSDNIPYQMYDASMLWPIYHATQNPEHKSAAYESLALYLHHSNNSPEESIYVLGLLADQSLIARTWHEKARTLYPEAASDLHRLNEGNTREVPPEIWLARPLGIQALSLLKLRTEDEVNLESLLIRNTVTLQKLSTNAHNTVDTMREAHMANFMLAPFAEIIGYDGLAMALQSKYFELRNIHTDNTWANDEAENYLAQMGSHGTFVRNTNRMLDQLLRGYYGEEVLKHDTDHGSVIVDGNTESGLRAKYRRKSLGSCARKLVDQQGKVPMDITGITLNASTRQELAYWMRHALEHIERDPAYTLHPSPGRTQSIHVKGTPEHVEEYRQLLGYDSLDEMKIDVDVPEHGPGENVYQVAKIMFLRQGPNDPYPVRNELQFITDDEGANARIGSTNHATHKLMGKDKPTTQQEWEVVRNSISDLQQIHRKRIHAGNLNLTLKGRQRAMSLLADIVHHAPHIDISPLLDYIER